MANNQKDITMEMIHTGGPYGDSCSSYDVQLNKACTVQEFVDMVLKERPNEWGEFIIITNFYYKSQKDYCKYEYGKITNDFKNSETKSQIISKVKAHGGWTAMDYIIKVSEY